jgi:type IV pilus assembly protein PilM
MPDWKKEIKLSDLVPKRKPKGEKAFAPKKQRKRKRHPQLVGLKIGSSQLSAAVVNNNGASTLSRLVSEPLPEGIVAGGEVRDAMALATALDGFFARNDLPRKAVRLGLSSTRIGVRAFDIAGIEDDRRLGNAIMFRAQETLPVPPEQAVMDYLVLSDTVDEDGNRTTRALLVVAYRELVEAFVSACSQAGIELAGVDLEAFGLLRALGAPAPEGETRPDGALVALSVGRDRSTLAVSDGRVCEFTRVLDWGGAMITEAIVNDLDMTVEDAERIKKTLTLDPEKAPHLGPAPERETEAREATVRALQTFARELVSSLRFYQGQPDSLPIAEIALTGGTSELGGLDTELERLIGVPVRVADPFGRVELHPAMQRPESAASLTVAIGLGIED